MTDTSTNTWTFSGLDRTRYNLTQQQAKEITEIYQQAYDNISKRIDEELKKSGNQRTLTVAYFDDLKKEIRREMQNVSKQLNVVIPKNMLAMSEATGKSADDFAESLGFETSSRWSAVSTDIVTSILSGEVYQKDWSFSHALWKDLNKNTKEIDTIVARGVTENRSAFEIAKDLETFVDPKSKKESRKIVYESYYRNGVKIPKKDYLNLSEAEKAKCEVKENTYYFGKVDYNAQRLARTLISHAYQQSLVNSCKPNPFVEGFIWQASGSDRMCPICAARDGKFYKKDELPLDHPNGMCTFTAAIPDMNDVADRLADWVNGKDDPALDNYAAYLGYGDIQMAKNDVGANSGLTERSVSSIIKAKESNISDKSTKDSVSLPPKADIGSRLFSEQNYTKMLRGERIISSNKYETAVIYNADGTIAFKKKGNSDSVSFTQKEIKSMQGKVLTHNHPNASIFSAADINIMRRGNISEIRACNVYGAYVIRRNGEWSKKLSSFQKINEAYNGCIDECLEKYKEIAARNGENFLKYFDVAEEEGLKNFCDKYNLEYTWEDKLKL